MEDYSSLADYELAAGAVVATGFFETSSCTGLLGDALLCPRPRSLEAERGDEDGFSAVLSSCRSGNASSSGESATSGGGRCKRPAAGAFEISFARSPAKRPPPRAAGSIDFRREADPKAATQVKEMIYRAAAFRPVTLGADEAVARPRRRNVRISSDPQTVAARHRRERISERLRALQRLVPGGSKLDTASMLDEAANYLKFLKSQVGALENSTTTHVNGGVIVCTTSGDLASPFLPTLLHPQQIPSHDGRNDCTQSHPSHRRGSVSM